MWSFDISTKYVHIYLTDCVLWNTITSCCHLEHTIYTWNIIVCPLLFSSFKYVMHYISYLYHLFLLTVLVAGLLSVIGATIRHVNQTLVSHTSWITSIVPSWQHNVHHVFLHVAHAICHAWTICNSIVKSENLTYWTMCCCSLHVPLWLLPSSAAIICCTCDWLPWNI